MHWVTYGRRQAILTLSQFATSSVIAPGGPQAVVYALFISTTAHRALPFGAARVLRVPRIALRRVGPVGSYNAVSTSVIVAPRCMRRDYV